MIQIRVNVIDAVDKKAKFVQPWSLDKIDFTNGGFMKLVLISCFFTVLVITACSSETTQLGGSVDTPPACPTGTADYIGCWDTPACQKLPASGSGNDRWAVDRIYLTESDQFFVYRKAYDNSSCNGDLAFSDLGRTYDFEYIQSITTAGSLPGHELEIDTSGTGAQLTSYTVFIAATMNNTLCLSNNWDVMDDGFKFRFEEGIAVNLSNCLDHYEP